MGFEVCFVSFGGRVRGVAQSAAMCIESTKRTKSTATKAGCRDG